MKRNSRIIAPNKRARVSRTDTGRHGMFVFIKYYPSDKGIDDYLKPDEYEIAAAQYGSLTSYLLAQFLAYLQTAYTYEEGHCAGNECTEERVSEFVFSNSKADR